MIRPGPHRVSFRGSFRGMASARVTTPRSGFRPLLAGRLVGAGLLVATGAIHLDLYLTGYRAIPTIGPLFLLQVIAAFLLAAVIAATSSWVAAVSGAGFAIATLGGYLLSIWVGLFGFKEVRTTAGIAAAIVELAAFGVLAGVALRATAALRPLGDATPAPALLAVAARVTAVAVFVVAAGFAAGALLTTSGAATTLNPRGQVQLGTRRVDGALVLTNPRGLTLYWFAIDSSAQSRCYGTCAAIWPPVLGHPVAGKGVVGRLGTITRANGALQATYDGHPLYTFAGDSPGTARGNDLNLNGGLWHEVIVAA
jgi:predicted lipoprotein with Yx(FWY)xxD motif